MNGYGSHTFKLVNKDGHPVYCKFVYKVGHTSTFLYQLLTSQLERKAVTGEKELRPSAQTCDLRSNELGHQLLSEIVVPLTFTLACVDAPWKCMFSEGLLAISSCW